jgi:hypothetical protein
MMSGSFLATESKKHQEPWQTAALDLPTVTDYTLVHFKNVCNHKKIDTQATHVQILDLWVFNTDQFSLQSP